MSHPATQSDDDLLKQCDIRFMRRSGPGGQNRNKVETAVILHHRPTGLIAEANETRSQQQNREAALFRLRMKLAVEVREEPLPEPSELWQSRCKGRKIKVNPEHRDLPSLIAEALDHVIRHEMNIKTAADVLECSTTQLVNLLKLEPRAISQLNDARTAKGLPPLR